MKTLKLLAVGIMLLIAGSAQSQISVNVHIGAPPAWGPAGYNNVHYYYLPDIECYYDVQASKFIYYSGNRWVRSRYVPARYKNYDLYGGYKVPMNNYRGNTPYTNFKEYKVKYAKGYRGSAQHNIGIRNGGGNKQQKQQVFTKPNKNENKGNDRGQVKNNNKNHGNDNNDDNKNGNRK